MLKRAYSLLTVKAIDDDARVIEGVASTVEVDRMGDVVVPEGAEFKLPIPLLWQHNSREPIGEVFAARVVGGEIQIKARIAKTDEPGRVKDRLDEAWHSIKLGLVRGLSIGFQALETSFIDTGIKFIKWLWLELSAVTIPANQSASIQVIRNLHTPGMTGNARAKARTGTPMTTQEQIKQYTERREAASKEMTEMMDVAAKEGTTLDAEQSEKYDALETEVESIDKHVKRLNVLAAAQSVTAKEVKASDFGTASASRGGVQITVKDNTPPGIGFTRVALAKLVARLDSKTVDQVVMERWPNDERVKQYFKAAVPAGTSTHATYAGPLVDQTTLASEFVEFLRPQTLVGRLPLRRVPFNIRFTSQTTGAYAGWVGEGRGKPVTSINYGSDTLLYTKIAAIAVITQELARFSSPSAEQLVRDELARAVVERLDNDFIDPAVAVQSGINPASITNGLTALSSAGTSADNIRTDIQNLLEQFILANMNAANVALIMPNTLALAASLLVNSLGQPEFPGLGINGGTLVGLPVFTTQYAANQSQYGNLVIALDPTAILLADDGNVDVSASMEASIEMLDAPTGRSDTPTAASLVSLWQTNSIGIKAERFINWKKARAEAVVYMADVNWGSIGSPS